ncbi:acyltransferase [Latilactobacillus sakei]|uniref:acyltransferase n=1 Tax=Latilactobacillus sakei TaxID=1599 RepID=UPI000C1B336E|nr:acyltransferase [Latilactobacillus sakei]
MSEKVNWDKLKFISMLAVVIIHVSARFLLLQSDQLNYWALFFNQISRFSVPVFLVASGYGLVVSGKDQQSYTFFIIERAKKVLPMFLVASFFYYVMFAHNIHSIFTIRELLVILTGRSYYHLYFIVILFMCYLLFPLMCKLVKWNTNLTLLFAFGIQLVSQLLGMSQRIMITEYNFLNWIFYFVLGIYLAVSNFEFRISFFPSVFIVLFSLVLVLCTSFLLYVRTKNIPVATTTMSPVVTLFSISCINLLLNYPWKIDKVLSLNISLLFYLVHPFFVAFFAKVIDTNHNKSFIAFFDITHSDDYF